MIPAQPRGRYPLCDARLGAALVRLHGSESELNLRGAWVLAERAERVLRWLHEGAPRPGHLTDQELGEAWLTHCRASAHYTGLLVAHTGLARRLDAGAAPAWGNAPRRPGNRKEGS